MSPGITTQMNDSTYVKAFRLDLPVELADEMTAILADIGMPRAEAMRRLFSWFVQLDDVTRGEILGSNPKGLPANVIEDVIRQAHQNRAVRRPRLAAKDKRKPTE